jgi:hypothetical protein
MSLIVLDSEEIAQVVFTVATPKAVCSILRTHSQVEAARRHLFENVDEARRDIGEFVRERLVDLEPKTYFSHEPAFCALAVALETLPIPAAEDFLSELAALRIAEMPISSRVASQCLQRRRELLASNTLTVFEIASPLLSSGPTQMEPTRFQRNSSYELMKAA